MEALSLPGAPAAALRTRRRASTGSGLLLGFGAVAVGVGAARSLTTSFLPVLLERIEHAPQLIGIVMLVNPAAGFFVPLAVGLWSDGRGRRLPFVIGGTLLTSGGLVAVALGTAGSYVLLALAGASVYVGLNAAATAHRAIVAESFQDDRRPAATSAQEVAMLAGGLVGIVAGGALIASAPSLLFLAVALVVPLLALPTVASVRRLGARDAGGRAPRGHTARPRDLIAVLRRPGAREVLVGQVLWVLAYAALPAFFILYADEVLGLGAGAAALLLAAFGLLTGAAMLGAGRASPERVYPLLVLGAALLGGGLLAATAADSLAFAALPFALAAVGFGLVTALGFPYFARFIPEGQAGHYSGLYFSSRAIASAVALPLSGLLIATTGSYRALLLQGAAGLVALVPLSRTRPRQPAAEPRRVAPGRLAAVIPCYGCEGLEPVLEETLRHVDEVVLVDDGSEPKLAGRIEAIGQRPGVRVVRLADNSGKGSAVAAGAAALLEGGAPPDAILVIDSDGQHPPDRIPDFVDAARLADVVIGDRTADRSTMPLARRLANSASSGLLSLVVRRRLADTQCGMRLYRVEALERVPLPPGRYEAETVHLKATVRAGLSVGWVPIPAIYDGAESSFRPLVDTGRVLRAILGRGPRAPVAKPALARSASGPARAFLRGWATRLGALLAGTLAIGALVPLVAPLDEQLFLAVNSLGDGPDWFYSVINPHFRNYVLLSVAVVALVAITRRGLTLGMAVTVLFAALFSYGLLEAVTAVIDRPRPSEVLAGDALLSHGHDWATIPSLPSGHVVVTTAIAAVAMSILPALRRPLWIWVGAIAVSRVLFGAHFPLDVGVGLVLGYEAGRFSVALAHVVGLVPATPARPALAGPAGRWLEDARCRLLSSCGDGALGEPSRLQVR